MDDRGMQFRVGAMMLGSIGIGVFLLFIFYARPSLLRGEYTIYIRFTEAPGVKADTPVQKSGVLIGRVTDVQLRDKQEDVLVTCLIDRKYTLHKNEVAQITTASLLGDSVVEFVPPAQGGFGPEITDGALLDGRVDMGAMQAIESASKALNVVVRMEDDITSAMEEFRISAAKFGQLSDHLNAITTNNEDQIRRIVQKTEMAMDNFNLAMLSINEVVADEQVRENLKRSLAGVPETLAQTQVAMQQFGAASQRANATFQKAEKTLEKTDEFATSLNRIGTAGEQMSARMDNVLDELELLIGDLRLITQAVNEQKGTVGQLVYNPSLYQRLDQAAANAQQATWRIQPVIEDARVFADKIARDPSQLGVRGALRRGDSGTKFLSFGRFRQSTPQPTQYQYHWQPTRPPPPEPGIFFAPQPMPSPAAQPCCPPTTPETFWGSQ